MLFGCGLLSVSVFFLFFFFFFNDTATTEIYTLSLHDALPDPTRPGRARRAGGGERVPAAPPRCRGAHVPRGRSEEHTSELQLHVNLVCRLLLEKKKKLQICYFKLLKKKIKHESKWSK